MGHHVSSGNTNSSSESYPSYGDFLVHFLLKPEIARIIKYVADIADVADIGFALEKAEAGDTIMLDGVLGEIFYELWNRGEKEENVLAYKSHLRDHPQMMFARFQYFGCWHFALIHG